MGLIYTAGVPPSEKDAEVCGYYSRILPFYDVESIARSHLSFWDALARRWRPKRILEIGAGLARVTAALSRRAPAVGIDLCLETLARARESRSARSARAHLVAADMRQVAFNCLFDLIVAPNDPFCHLTSAADRRRALRAVARQLSPSGRFVLDGLYRPRRTRFEPAERRLRHEKGALTISETWLPIGTRELWRARYLYENRQPGKPDRVLEASFVARAWNPAEIRSFFAGCGLTVERLWGDFDRHPFRKNSSRILIVVRRSVDR
jgi:SAM-dependent methyltransferase